MGNFIVIQTSWKIVEKSWKWFNVDQIFDHKLLKVLRKIVRKVYKKQQIQRWIKKFPSLEVKMRNINKKIVILNFK